MEINLLVLAVGNSRLAVGAFAAGELQHVKRVPIDSQAAWREAIADAWAHIADCPSPAVAAASVNPALDGALGDLAHAITRANVQWVGRDIDLPIKVLTDAPEQTGIDRILAVAAAYEQMAKACIVVDAGTAITINVCNDEGQFLGGAIAPGLEMMLDALHEKTARLPRVGFALPDGPFGKDTQQAILQGAYHGIRGLVKELAENYATELGAWPDIIATGGDAEKLFEGWELIHAIAPDLLLYGIALAYAEHHIRHDT